MLVLDAERSADIRVLAFGLAVAIGASAGLLSAALIRGSPRAILGAALYVAGLLAMLGCSLLYRSARETRRRQFLRRLDHAAIFAMIAGSATPFALARGGSRGLVIAAALWLVAAFGIAFKLSFPIGGIRRSAMLYLMVGWISSFAVGPALSAQTVTMIAIGGIFYSAGIPFLLWRRLPYRLAIWHLFVLAGAACHYVAILDRVVLA